MDKTDVELGERLYKSLPAVYRVRDNGDLKKFLDACGQLLNRVHDTLDQRLADSFPDNPLENDLTAIEQDTYSVQERLACQEWLLPYFAQLLDVRMVSPDVKGRRDEVSNAVEWRQRKGTLSCVEEIAESVGQMEVEVQEGWKRVAITPRIGTDLLPATAYGYEDEPDMSIASMATRHPGLPTVTVDLRYPNGAVETDELNADSHTTSFNGEDVTWRQANYFGVPCHPGSYDDVSLRTVDIHSPAFDTATGFYKNRYHPRRILMYVPPPAGFFPPRGSEIGQVKTLQWKDEYATEDWADYLPAALEDWFEVEFSTRVNEDESTDEVITFRNKTYETDDYLPLLVRGIIDLSENKIYRFEGLHLDNTLVVHFGRVEMVECAARKAELHSIDYDDVIFTAKNCLIKTLYVARGYSQLEYCTVLTKIVSEGLNASDCILLETFKRHHTVDSPPPFGCIRYSAIKKGVDTISMSTHANTMDVPIFFEDTFGKRSCSVLHPATSENILFGAEDGGEMGAYHGRRYVLLALAMLEKLKDFLPVGMEPVLIHDEHLLDKPK